MKKQYQQLFEIPYDHNGKAISISVNAEITESKDLVTEHHGARLYSTSYEVGDIDIDSFTDEDGADIAYTDADQHDILAYAEEYITEQLN